MVDGIAGMFVFFLVSPQKFSPKFLRKKSRGLFQSKGQQSTNFFRFHYYRRLPYTALHHKLMLIALFDFDLE